MLFSCTHKVKEKSVTHFTQDSTVRIKVTILANLPDSLQPETILLENTPAPKTIRIPDKPISFTINHKSGPHILNLAPAEKTKVLFSPVLKNYTTEQGLALDLTTCGYADKKGNLWFGTTVNGVSKYDGHSFTNYTTSQGLIENRINSIIEDRAGNIWFATPSGVSKFDGTTFSTFGKFKDVFSIFEDRSGNFWFCTRDGLYKYAGDSISWYSEPDGLPANTDYDLMEDSKGILCVCSDKGLFRYDGTRFTNIAVNKDDVDSICKDKSGNGWASTPPGYRLNKFHDLVSGVSIEDKSGNVWFCTAAKGVVKYSGQAFLQLTDKSFRSIFEDKSGNIWLSGSSDYITRFDGEYFTNFGFNNASIWCIFQDRSGNIWMGKEDGELIKFENNSFTFYTDLNGLPDNRPQFIAQDSKGYLWIGTEKGLSKFDGKSFTNFTKKQGLAGDLVSCIMEDKPGELLIGTDGGLSRYDGKSFTNYSISQLPLGNDTRSLIKDKNGNLWMGTYGGGLCRFDGKSFYTYTTEQGLSDNVVTQVALTNEGSIIAGTNNGIALLTGFKSASDEANSSKNPSANRNYSAQNNLSNSELKNFTPVFEIYNPKTGYPVMDVNRGQHAIFKDSKGILWIASGSSKSGLMRFDYSSLYKNSNPPSLNLLAVKVDNELVCWRDLLNTEKNDQKPKSKFESIAVPASVTEEVTTFGKTLSDAQRQATRINYKEIEFDDVSKFYPVPQNLKLPHRHNNITIEFAAIEPDKPLLVQYQYKLEGYDKNWSTPANITSATFGNMYEGTYQFKVKARSPSGIWSEPVTYSFTVLPPWWRTWWFRSIVVLVLLLSIYLYTRYRTRSLLERQKYLQLTVDKRTEQLRVSLTEKEALLKEIHHRVKNNLEVMSSLLKLQTKNVIDENAKAALIEGQGRIQSIALIHHKLYSSDDMANIEIKDFANGLFKHISNVFRKPGEKINFIVSGDDTSVNTDIAVPLGLILNELFTNAFKYAMQQDRENLLSLQIKEPAIGGKEVYHMIFSDNGPGMPESFNLEKSKSLGMKVIQLLTKQLGGELNYYNKDGAVFEISFPKSAPSSHQKI